MAVFRFGRNHFWSSQVGKRTTRQLSTMQSWPGEENYAVSTMNQCAKFYSCVFNQKRVDVRSGSKKKSPKTVEIKSRNASFAILPWIPRACGYWRSRRIGSISEGDVDSTAPSCARNLLPSLGRFLMLQRRNRWKKWLKWLFCAVLRRVSKALQGIFRRLRWRSFSSWNIIFRELMLPSTELRHIPPFTEPV